MHELVVTGRKVGFERDDWKGLAHNQQKLRDTLDFARGRTWKAHSVLANMLDEERLTWLSEAIVELHTYLGFCINCGFYKDQWKVKWPDLRTRLQKLQLPGDAQLDEIFSENESASSCCFQVSEVLRPICDQLLKVEGSWWGGYINKQNGSTRDSTDSQCFRKDHEFPPCLHAAGTSLTQASVLLRLVELCKAKGQPIQLAIRFE